MTLESLPGWALRMLEAERVGRLAYVDENDHPRVLPVTFAPSGGAVWSAIDDVKPKREGEPARVRCLRRRPAAALLVDVYDDDWTRLAWVQLLGRVELLSKGAPAAASEAVAALAALTAKYEQYAERTPPGPLLRLDVDRALRWRAAD